MCGIVGVVGAREVQEILLTGLERLEYRGYDSAGVATLENGSVHRTRRLGKVAALREALTEAPTAGRIGIAHTRWATHGVPSEKNAHPHMSGDGLALVHNGIIENHESLRRELQGLGYVFESETDTETVVHLIHHTYAACGDLREAVRQAVQRLEGAYGLVVLHQDHPDELIAARQGSPLVVGVGIGEMYLASDPLALRPVTDRFVFMEEGDLVVVRREGFEVFSVDDETQVRATVRIEMAEEDTDKRGYAH
ncbi:MAG: glutamine--fructose-6-phosphate aminotransferase, partial [Schleiferiaceae bacterium]